MGASQPQEEIGTSNPTVEALRAAILPQPQGRRTRRGVVFTGDDLRAQTPEQRAALREAVLRDLLYNGASIIPLDEV